MDAINLLAKACSETALSSLVDDTPTAEKLHIIVEGEREGLEDEENDDDLSLEEDENSENQLDGDNADLQGKISSRGNWTVEEDEKLRKAVAEYGGRNWKKIAEQIAERTDVQCLHRWQKVLRPGLIKGPWTPEVWHNPICILLFV